MTELEALAAATFVVEAVVEDYEVKAQLLGELGAILAPEAILASTTSSLSVERLAQASGRPERFLGLHVFNPVHEDEARGAGLSARRDRRDRGAGRSRCATTFEKTPVEVPDLPGFVVNRLLFPYLFSAVRLLEETGLDPADVDTCMRLGAGHPMGPLALLDLVGLDVSEAIGETIGRADPGAHQGADRRGRARAQERTRVSRLPGAVLTSAGRRVKRAIDLRRSAVLAGDEHLSRVRRTFS